MTERPRRGALAFALAAVLSWSTVASAFELSLRVMDTFQLLFWSASISTVVLAAVLVVRGGVAALLGFDRRQVVASICLGMLNPFLYYLVLFEAYDRLPAQEAQPLNYTWAITLTLLSIPLLRQRPTVADLVATIVCWIGVLVISTHGAVTSMTFSDPVGVALALGSTVIWAFYWIFNARDDGRDPVAGLFLGFLASLLPVGVTCAVFSSLWPLRPAAWAGAAWVGVFEMGLTYVLWLEALRRAENTSRVATLIFLSPFLSLVMIAFVVGETIRWSTLVGLGLIVAGLLIQKAGKRRDR